MALFCELVVMSTYMYISEYVYLDNNYDMEYKKYCRLTHHRPSERRCDVLSLYVKHRVAAKILRPPAFPKGHSLVCHGRSQRAKFR